MEVDLSAFNAQRILRSLKTLVNSASFVKDAVALFDLHTLQSTVDSAVQANNDTITACLEVFGN